MAAVDVNAIVEDGFQVSLANLTNARGVTLRSEGHEPDSANPPCVFVLPDELTAATLNRSSQLLSFNVVILVAAANGPSRQRQELSDWYRRIDDALDADPTLQGQVSGILDVRVEPGRFFGDWPVGGMHYPCIVATVDVITG